jgi:hypothetical protein
MTDNCKKKICGFPVPSRDFTYQTLPDRECIKFPARESLVSDNPSGDRKTANLFYSVYFDSDPMDP